MRRGTYQPPTPGVQLIGNYSFSASDTNQTFISNLGTPVAVSGLVAGLAKVTLVQAGTGVIAVSAASGVTINGPLVTGGQGSQIQLIETQPGVYMSTLLGAAALAAFLATLPATLPSTPGTPWNNGGVISIS